jgi:hypothetical protein
MIEFQCLYKEYQLYNPYQLSVSSFVTYLKYAIELLGQKTLDNQTKHITAVALLRESVIRSPMSITDKKLCTKILNTGLIDDMINVLVGASQGGLKVNKQKCKFLCMY